MIAFTPAITLALTLTLALSHLPRTTSGVKERGEDTYVKIFCACP
jgi:hypothetical protein